MQGVNNAVVKAVLSVLVVLGIVGLSFADSASAGAGQSTSLSATVIINSYFPATSAQYNSHPPSPLQDFYAQAITHLEYSCLARDGFPQSEIHGLLVEPNPVIYPTSNDFYPDIKRLQEGNIGLVPEKTLGPTGPPMSAAEAAAFQAAYTNCNRQLAHELPTDSAMGPIVSLWQKDLSGLLSVPSVVKATREWSACMSARGFPVNTVHEWDLNMNALLINEPMKYRSNPYFAPEMVVQVKAFGQCVVPLANAMDAVRLGYRAKLLDEYGAELVTIANTLSREIAVFEKKFRLSITMS